MDIVLRPHHPYTTAYLDNIVIHSNNWQDHLNHLREVMGGFCKVDLTANPKDSIWG